jgi:hypothetical protein
MDDRERIEALVADGRITREEADRLIRVLDDIDGAEQQLDEVDEEVQRHGGRDEPGEGGERPGGAYSPPGPAAPTPPRPPVPPRAPDAPGQASTATNGLRWVEVQLLAGDLEIRVEEGLESPTVSSNGPGELGLERSERGFRLKGGVGAEGSSLLGRLLGGIARGDVELCVPKGWGVRLDMKAGDVEVRGPLAFLKGDLLAGDLDADELHGVDLRVKAGDIDLAVRIDEGSHRIQALAGDLNVRLLEGSDVELTGRVNIGDLSLPKEWSRSGRGLGSTFEHKLGRGAGKLALELGTGDLDVEVDDG